MKNIYMKSKVLIALILICLAHNAKAQDAGVSKILTPVNLSCGSANDVLEVIVSNYGSTTISAIPVTAKITGSASITLVDTLKKNIASGAQDTLTFKTKINDYNGGTFKYNVFTILSGDKSHINDTMTQTFLVYPFPDTPQIPKVSICGTGLVNFVAKSTTKGSKTYWYPTNTSTTFIGIGDTLKKTITATTTYYAASLLGSGANSKSTTFSGGNSQVGNMFDVHVKNNISIDSFDVSPSFTGSDSIVFYYRQGTYSGYSSTTTGWTRVGAAYVTSSSSSSGNKVRAAFNGTKPQLQAGQSYGFCLYSYKSNIMNYTNGSTSYTDSFYNSDIVIYSGIGITGFPASTTFSPRDWNGTIYYSTPSCASGRIAVTATLIPPVKSLTLTKDAASKGAVNRGTSTNPDQVCINDSLKYDLSVPLNFSNADYGTKWKVTYSMKSISGQPVSNYAYTNPSSTTKGQFVFAPVKSNQDSVYELIVDADNIVSGCDSIFVRYINVVPGFKISNACLGHVVPFSSTATSSGRLSYFWGMGDGDSVSGDNQTYLYTSAGSYNVTQIAYNAGCKATTSKTVTVNISPLGASVSPGTPFRGQFNPGDILEPDYTCIGDTNTYQINLPKGLTNSDYGTKWVITSVSLKTLSGSGPYSKDTATKFPSGGKGATFSFHPTKYGDSLYFLQIGIRTFPGNCDSVFSRYIKIMVKPTAGFSFTNNCFGTPLNFKDTSTLVFYSSLTNWNWNFGDGNTSNLQNPDHAYSKAGSYTVKFTAISDAGCANTISKSVQQYPTPTEKFGQVIGCSGFPTKFLDSSTITSGTIKSWDWIFGDGTTSSQKSPLHSFTNAGAYKVNLVETSALGCADTITKTITILPAPLASFSYNNACTGLPIYFANTSTDPAGKPKYNWDFGTGVFSSTSTNPTYTYTKNGNYSARLVVISSNGCTDTSYKTITPYLKPIVKIAYKNTCPGLPVSYADTGTNDGTSTYNWKYGDNGSDQLNVDTAAHTYANPGTYQVSLSVQNGEGCTDSAQASVVISSLPKAGFTLTDVCINKQPATFLNTSTGGTLTYLWNLGDSSKLLTTANATHTYSATGTYNVTLTATNASHCVDSITKAININPLPVITAWTKKQNQSTVTFVPKDTSIGAFKWHFGDAGNDSSSTKIPTFVYPLGNGRYGVKLFVTNRFGCVAERTDSVFTGKFNGIDGHVNNINGLTIFPNPFEGITHINYTLESPSNVNIAVYDLNGKQVAVLKNGLNGAGEYSDILDATKWHCPQGVYILKMTVNDEAYTTRIENMK